MEELKITLTNISEKLSNYYYINCGGCCLYAYLIAKQLDIRKIPYKVIIEHPYYSKREYNNQAQNQSKYLTIHHTFLRISGKFYYDFNGIQSRWHKDKVSLNIDSEKILNLYTNGSWNPAFKELTSKTRIKKLKQIIKQEFNEYDKRVENSMRY